MKIRKEEVKFFRNLYIELIAISVLLSYLRIFSKLAIQLRVTVVLILIYFFIFEIIMKSSHKKLNHKIKRLHLDQSPEKNQAGICPRSTPLDNTEQGYLDYSKFVENIVSIIKFIVKDNKCGNEPFYIGLFGEYGVGKSSIINLVKNKMSNQNISFIIFHPWQYHDSKWMAYALMNRTINEILGTGFNDRETQIDSISMSLGLVNINLSDKKLIEKDFVKDFEELIVNIENKLIKNRKWLMIVLDDIDRVPKKEIYNFMRYMRAFFNIKRTIIIFSMDQKYHSEVFSTTPPLDEKFFDFSVNVAIEGSLLVKTLLEQLDIKLKSLYNTKEKNEYYEDWKEELNVIKENIGLLEIFSSVIRTPRVINYIVRNVILICSARKEIPKLLSITDLILVTILKQKFPLIYHKFATGEFNFQPIIYKSDYSDGSELKEELDKLISNKDIEMINALRKIFRFWNLNYPLQKGGKDSLKEIMNKTVGIPDQKRIWFGGNSTMYFHILDELYSNYYTYDRYLDFKDYLGKDTDDNLFKKIEEPLSTGIELLQFLLFLNYEYDELKKNPRFSKNLLITYLYLNYKKREIEWKTENVDKSRNSVPEMERNFIKLIESYSYDDTIQAFSEFLYLLNNINAGVDEYKIRSVFSMMNIIITRIFNSKNEPKSSKYLSPIYCLLNALIYLIISMFPFKQSVIDQCFREEDNIIKTKCEKFFKKAQSSTRLSEKKISGNGKELLQIVFEVVISNLGKWPEYEWEKLSNSFRKIQIKDVKCSDIRFLYNKFIDSFNKNIESSKLAENSSKLRSKLIDGGEYYWGIYGKLLKIIKCLHCSKEIH